VGSGLQDQEATTPNRKNAPVWTAEELQIIRDYYPHERAKRVAARLQNFRTAEAVIERARVLGVKRVIVVKRVRKTGRRLGVRQIASQRRWLTVCADLARGNAQDQAP
jgi:hypothetical protein